MTLGDVIRAYRNEHDLSMEKFAASCGLSKGYISMLENNFNPKTGKPIVPSLEVYKAAAAAMHVDFNDLLNKVDADAPVKIASSRGRAKKVPAPKCEDGHSAIDKQLIEMLRGLSPEHLQRVKDFIAGLKSC